MIVLLVTCLAALLCPSVHSQAWCYHKPECNFTTWPQISPQFCNGSSQSPINIVTASVQENPNLTSFNFTDFDDNSTKLFFNTGYFAVITPTSETMSVEGGDLPGLYNTLTLRFHWGNGSSSPGSEHTVDGKQYPMELHIVNVHSKYNGDLTAALAANDSTALAVLAFFIEVTSEKNYSESWNILTSSLTDIPIPGPTAVLTGVTLDALLEGVDRTKYYRYQGSLTTPKCNENVIWTLFKDPIKISQDMINRFSTTINFKAESGSARTRMTNNFRGVQPLNGRIVTSQGVKTTGPSSTVPSSTSPSSTATSTLSIITVLLLSSLF